MPENLPISKTPQSDRPRERLLNEGPGVLSNTELLAIILRSGTPQENAIQLAGRILAEHGGLHGLGTDSACGADPIQRCR